MAAAACAGGSGGDDDPDGECGVLTGDLVITEVMANPQGMDTGQEYFEIFNASSLAIDLAGIALEYRKSDGSGEKRHTMSELVIQPGDYLALGSVADGLVPDHLDYGYGDDLGSMLNGGAVLALRCGDTVIDEVTYPDMEASRFDGVAFGIDGNVAPDHLFNDAGESFCPATVEFAPGMFGSPGEANEVCNVVTPGRCSDGDADRDVVPPAAGDLVISEFMASPDGADGDQEWFEVFAVREVDLNGLVAGIEPGVPKLNIDDDACVTLEAGERAVFARKADAELNDGLPAPVATFTFALTDASTLFIGVGDAVIDTIAWTDVTASRSTALLTELHDPEANDDESSWVACGAPYGAGGNFGTPGDSNAACDFSGMCRDGDVTREIVAAQAGDLRITEVLPDPAGTGNDATQEWFEVEALADVDLNGLTFGRMDTVALERTVDAVDCMPLAVGGRALFARATADNGGLPPVDVEFDFSLPQDDGVLYIGPLADPIDTFAYGTVTDGVARQLEPAGAVTCDAVAAYGTAGNLGTPALANTVCDVVTPGMCDDGGIDRAVVTPEVGDLVITEVMQSPAGADSDQEWFEVHATSDVDLNGLVAGTVPGEPKLNIDDTDCVSVVAGQYVVFARTDATDVNDGLPPPVALFGFSLTASSSLYIGIGDDVLDQVSWTTATADRATSLDPGATDTAANDDEASWCPAEDPYGEVGNFGTPGEANPVCPIVCDPGQCYTGDTCRAIVPPTEGQIRVTEVMPNPEGAEPAREWFEITASADFDLFGLQIGKDGALSAVLDTDGECAPVTSGDVIVLARTGNDDLPAFDYPMGVGLSNGSTNSTVIGHGDVILDTFTYGTVSEGKSRQLDPDGSTVCNTPSTTPYTAGKTLCGGANDDPTVGNCGTPGVANPDC